MLQNIIFPNRDNPVVINFTFNVPTDPTFGLNSFDEIFVQFAGEEYSSVSDPTIVVVSDNTTLELYLGTEVTAETIPTYFTIWGTNATYPAPEGYLLTNKCYGNLGAPCIC